MNFRLNDLEDELFKLEADKGINYKYYKSAPMYQDPKTKQWYDTKTGKKLLDEEVRARFNKKSTNYISIDDTDIAGNSLVDTFMNSYIDSKKSNNDIQKIIDDQTNISNWKKCCSSKDWRPIPGANRNTGPILARELKTFINYYATNSRPINYKDFAEEFGLNINTVRSHFEYPNMQLSIQRILSHYNVNLKKLIEYIYLNILMKELSFYHIFQESFYQKSHSLT